MDEQTLRQVNLPEFLNYKGYQQNEVGFLEYEVLGIVLLDDFTSDWNPFIYDFGKIIVKKSGYRVIGTSKEGDALDFCKKVLNMDRKTALMELLVFVDLKRKNLI